MKTVLPHFFCKRTLCSRRYDSGEKYNQSMVLGTIVNSVGEVTSSAWRQHLLLYWPGDGEGTLVIYKWYPGKQ
jgi:hypothetical protein